MSMNDLLKHFRRSNRGSAATEFVLVAMILFTMVAGVIEFAGIMFVNVLIEGGLREASRAGITGYVPPGTTREDRIMEIVERHTQNLIDMSTADIDTLVYPSFEQIGQPEPFDDANANGQFDPGEGFTDVNGNGQWDEDMGVAGLGGPGDIVLYRLSYDWSLLTGLLDTVLGEEGRMRLSGRIVVRNEPF